MKMCPMLASGLKADPNAITSEGDCASLVSCKGDKCRWWHDGECAMLSIASSLNDLSKEGIRVSPSGLGGLK